MPREPFCQIAAKAASDTRMERTAQPSAPNNVATAGLHFEETEAHHDDRDHHRDHGKHRQMARPGRQIRHRLLLIGSGKPAGHG